ncbi:MAG: hypothetical protein M1331_02675 [Candidatus Marsarchaeota archaeon]|nr:hypothetical protein [Candidatus Marsarchaeota archaeon]MCL5106271.1 hypothetical protein [Candidatus Marsarchaeota archaeon]
MIGKSAEEKGYISLVEVLEILNRQKQEKELTYEQDSAMKHASKFAIHKEKYQKEKKELEAMNILSEQTIIKILDVSPKTEILLKQILAYTGRAFEEKEIASILNIIK